MKKLVIFAIIFAFAMQLSAQDITRKNVKMTIYNTKFAVVNEIINADLSKGKQSFSLTDLPLMILPESIKLDFDGNIHEQSYHFDLFDMNELLSRSIDKQISLFSKSGDRYFGKLLVFNNLQIILQEKSGNIIMIPKYEDYTISLDNLPKGFISKPKFEWLLTPKKAGNNSLYLSYQTEGISWDAIYTLILEKDEKSASIVSWFNIINNTSVDFEDASIKLFAGKVNRNNNNRGRYIAKSTLWRANSFEYERDADYGGSSRGIAFDTDETKIMDSYFFDLPQKISILNNQSKQIPFFSTDKIAVKKRYYAYYPDALADYKTTPYLSLIIENKKENRLGRIFPSGNIKVFKKTDNEELFVGEGMIQDSKVDDEISIRISDSFDVKVNQIITSNEIRNNTQELNFLFTVENLNSKDNIELFLSMFVDTNTEIIDCSHRYEMLSKSLVRIHVNVAISKTEEITLKTAKSLID